MKASFFISFIPYTSYFILLIILSTLYLIPNTIFAATRLQMPPNYLRVNSGLVGYWTFDGATTTWSSATAGTTGDLSGNFNTGTLTNMNQATSPTVGKIGQALSFDGVDDVVYQGPVGSSLTNLGPMAVSAWIKLNTDNCGIIAATSHTITAPFGGWEFEVGSCGYLGKLTFLRDFSGATNLLVSAFQNSIIKNQWTHVVISWDGSTTGSSAHLYINGIKATSYDWQENGAGSKVTDSGKDFNIGVNNNGEGTFNGLIDDVRVYNRALSASEISFLYSSGQAKFNKSPTSFLTTGLVGYWTFDGATTTWSGATAGTTGDLSGNFNIGTLTNMSRATSPTVGKIGQALNFDGVNDYIDLGAPSVLDLNSRYTLSAWVYTTKPGTGVDFNGQVVDLGAAACCGAEIAIYSTWSSGAGQYRFAYAHAGNTDIIGTQEIQTNRWYHLTATWDGSRRNFYVDGVQDGTRLYSSAPTEFTNNSFIGSFDGSDYWKGRIDDVRIYNRALSADEIKRLYNLGR